MEEGWHTHYMYCMPVMLCVLFHLAFHLGRGGGGFRVMVNIFDLSCDNKALSPISEIRTRSEKLEREVSECPCRFGQVSVFENLERSGQASQSKKGVFSGPSCR
ncbi:hypothetical protein QR685DRAFT_509094 [Neurospora intermedia]|uniref:Uncharacterized protein n=1 Tax=Neurospora intermedia TaxID=5142 RepID=A0ABR3DNH8_NEUIN